MTTKPTQAEIQILQHRLSISEPGTERPFLEGLKNSELEMLAGFCGLGVKARTGRFDLMAMLENWNRKQQPSDFAVMYAAAYAQDLDPFEYRQTGPSGDIAVLGFKVRKPDRAELCMLAEEDDRGTRMQLCAILAGQRRDFTGPIPIMFFPQLPWTDEEAFQEHRNADPHCTCNDCLAYHYDGPQEHPEA